MPTSRFTCATEDENSVGSISLPTLRTSGCRNPIRRRGRRPSRPSSGHSRTSCRKPAISTPQARPIGGTSKRGASQNIAAIMVRLCRTGVNAGSPNLPKLFRIEAASAIIEMKVRYGKVTRSMALAWANFSGWSTAQPGVNRPATSGASSTPAAATTSTTAHSAPAMWSMKSFSAALSPRCLIAFSTGTKAIAIEPSANTRRRKLGIR